MRPPLQLKHEFLATNPPRPAGWTIWDADEKFVTSFPESERERAEEFVKKSTERVSDGN